MRGRSGNISPGGWIHKPVLIYLGWSSPCCVASDTLGGGLVEKKVGIRCIEQSVSSPYQWWDVFTQGKAPIPQPSYVTQGRHSWLSRYRRYELLYNHISTVFHYSYDPLFYHKYSIYLPAELLEAHIPMLLCSFPQRFVGYPCTVSRLSLKIWYQNEAFWGSRFWSNPWFYMSFSKLAVKAGTRLQDFPD